jgi:hypothetical protein
MLAKTKLTLKAAAMRFAALGPAAHTLIHQLAHVVSHIFGGPCV